MIVSLFKKSATFSQNGRRGGHDVIWNSPSQARRKKYMVRVRPEVFLTYFTIKNT